MQSPNISRIFLIVLIIVCAGALPAFSQTRLEEIDRLRDSVLSIHQNDEFYLHIRALPGVRFSIQDYVLTRIGTKWNCKYFETKFNPPPGKGDNRTRRKKVSTVYQIPDSSMGAFLTSIQADRLEYFRNSDSVLLDISKLATGTGYFIIICSKGNTRLIEYPVFMHHDQTKDWRTQDIYWQSDFIDNLIANFRRAAFQ